VAYAEKRGRGRQPWRVKYKLPSGVETSESGFETKAAARASSRRIRPSSITRDRQAAADTGETGRR